MTYYTDDELSTEVVVTLTLRDLTILNWGHESVSFTPGSHEALEFAAAEAKLDAALEEARSKIL